MLASSICSMASISRIKGAGEDLCGVSVLVSAQMLLIIPTTASCDAIAAVSVSVSQGRVTPDPGVAPRPDIFSV